MSLADDFDKIGGPLQKKMVPQKKPAPPPKAAADATAVQGRTLDNVLPTMDEHGVSDVVSHLSHTPTAAPLVDEFERERARRASVQQGRVAAEQAAKTGQAGQLDTDLAQADKNLAASRALAVAAASSRNQSGK